MKQKQMKRFGFLYEQIVSVENCKQAILDASKHKKKRATVQSILTDLDTNAEDLSKRLIELDFLTPYTTRIIKDGLSATTETYLLIAAGRLFPESITISTE